MHLIRLMPVLTDTAPLLLPATGVYAQPQPRKNDYTPKIGQSGKDVMWAPTSHSLVDNMLDMANVAPDDYVIDLGSGDGRTVTISGGRLRGEQISFAGGGAEYSGRVNNGWIEGSVKSGAGTLAWSATLRADNPVSSAKSP